jgi:hypothetical protein
MARPGDEARDLIDDGLESCRNELRRLGLPVDDAYVRWRRTVVPPSCAGRACRLPLPAEKPLPAWPLRYAELVLPVEPALPCSPERGAALECASECELDGRLWREDVGTPASFM